MTWYQPLSILVVLIFHPPFMFGIRQEKFEVMHNLFLLTHSEYHDSPLKLDMLLQDAVMLFEMGCFGLRQVMVTWLLISLTFAPICSFSDNRVLRSPDPNILHPFIFIGKTVNGGSNISCKSLNHMLRLVCLVMLAVVYILVQYKHSFIELMTALNLGALLDLLMLFFFFLFFCLFWYQ